MMNFYHPFRKPKKNLFFGFGQADATQQAAISTRTTGGISIYDTNFQQPLRSEIMASPIDDPVLANAVSRVQYHPTQAFVTRIPEAIVAQPMTYQEMQRQVGTVDYRGSQEPQVYLQYNPTPMQRVDLVPRGDYPVVIPAPGTSTIEGGSMLPPSLINTQPFTSREEGVRRDSAYANRMAYIAAAQARYSGAIRTQVPGSNGGLTTPALPATTIPQIEQGSPFTTQNQEKLSDIMPGASVMPGASPGLITRQGQVPESMVQGDYIQPVQVATAGRFPWWILLVGVGLYLFSRGVE